MNYLLNKITVISFENSFIFSISITIIDFLYSRSLISILLDWVSFLAHPNLYGTKGFVVVVDSFILTHFSTT
jgi:hypothetical protein